MFRKGRIAIEDSGAGPLAARERPRTRRTPITRSPASSAPATAQRARRECPGSIRHRRRGACRLLPQPIEVAGQVSRRGVALLRVLRETALGDPAQGLGGLGSDLSERRRIVLENRRERLDRRRARECPAAGDELVQDRPEGELIRTEVDRPAARLLRRHVAHGPEDQARARPSLERLGVALESLRNGRSDFARPKSRIFAKPSAETMMFSGFRSR